MSVDYSDVEGFGPTLTPLPSGRGKRGPDRKPRRSPRSESPREKAVNAVSERSLHSDIYMDNVRHHLGGILTNYFGFRHMPFHLELLRHMFEGGTWVVNWPTDHAKSWMTSYFFPLLSLMNNPDESHILCGANLNDSKRRVQMIQREIETNQQLIDDYPWLQKPATDVKSNWSTTMLTVAGRSVNKADPSVLASSTTSGDIKGRRGKLIMDDIEGEDHRSSALKRARLYDWVKLEAIRCLEDKQESSRPLLLACGTPYDVDSIYFRLDNEGWKPDRRPIYLDPKPWRSTDPWDHAKHLLWPAKMVKVRDQYRRLTKDQFAIAYLMDPKAGNPNRLSLDEIRALTLNAEAPGAQALTFVSIDPASGSAARYADYCGITVNRIHWPKDEKLPRVEVLEAHKLEYPAGLVEHVDLASDLARRYECRVIYESNAQQGGVYANMFHHRRPEVKLIRFHTGGSGQGTNKFDEEMGLTVIRRLVRESRLLVPQSRIEDEGYQALLKEVRDLGSIRHNVHDHLCASIWFTVRWIYNQVRTVNAPVVVNHWGGPPSRGRTDYIDREPALAATPSTNGWSVRPYRRWGS